VIDTTRIGDPADPKAITGKVARLESLEWGGAILQGMNCVFWDRGALYAAGAPRGVLGLPLFADLLLTLDYPRQQVSVQKGALSGSGKEAVVAYRPSAGGTCLIPISVAGKPFEVHLDSGSPGGLMLPKSYLDSLPLASAPVVAGRGRTVNSEFTIYHAPLNGALEIGQERFVNPDIRFNEVLPDGVVGYGILHSFAITLDQRQRRIRFQRGAGDSTAKASAAIKGDEFAGSYGKRRISFEDGSLYLQRTDAPPQRQGSPRVVAPKLRLVPLSADEFGLEESAAARIRFVREGGRVVELRVLTRAGEWESARRNAP
jgi:hypothetical protein